MARSLSGDAPGMAISASSRGPIRKMRKTLSTGPSTGIPLISRPIFSGSSSRKAAMEPKMPFPVISAASMVPAMPAPMM